MIQSFLSAQRFSVQALQTTSDGDLSFEEELVHTYITSTTEKGEQFKYCLLKNDLQNARTYVHGIKSASLYVGANRVAAIASHLEKLCENNEVDNARLYLDEFFKEIGEVTVLLKQYLQTHNKSS